MRNILKKICFVFVVCISFTACTKKTSINSIYRSIGAWQKRYQVPNYAENKKISKDVAEQIISINPEIVAKCNNGVFIGEREDDVVSWKGIPYAKAPVGDLRFKRSVLPDDDNNYYEALNYGKASIQPYDPDERASHYELGEDCLKLNIWSSVNNECRLNKDKKKAVFVYVHGGGWCFGGTVDPLYDGFNFAHYNPDVLVCTIAYRTGMLGQINLNSFLDENNKSEYSTSMTNSVLDQVTALHWIYDNIEAFGGNKDNITIAGESAGGGAVSLLCTIPEARKYIKKAIPMSGGVNQAVDFDKTVELSKAFQDQFNIKNIDDVKNIGENELIDWWGNNGTSLLHHCVKDGVNIEKDPLDVWRRGDTKDLIIMQGHTASEFNYYLEAFLWDKQVYDAVCLESMEEFAAQISNNKKAKEDFEKYKKVLSSLVHDEKDIAHEYMNDHSLAFINTYQATLHARNGGKGYSYTFEKSYDGSFKELGAAHAVDCYYLFGNFDGDTAYGTNDEVELSRKYQEMITNFCISGDPSIEGYQWPIYTEKTRYKMMVGDNLRVEKNPEKERVELLVDIEDESGEFLKGSTLAAYFGEIYKKKPEIMIDFIIKNIGNKVKLYKFKKILGTIEYIINEILNK